MCSAYDGGTVAHMERFQRPVHAVDIAQYVPALNKLRTSAQRYRFNRA